MDHKIEAITPELAAEYLACCRGNRPLRKSHVRALADAILRDEWKTTHQGIAFATGGALLDGQHRLHAIVESGRTVSMVVARNVDANSFAAMDIGAKRSISDALVIDKRIAETLRFLAFIYQPKSAAVTPAQVSALMGTEVETSTADLIAHCGTARRSLSSSPVRSGAVIAILNGAEKNRVLELYRAFVLSDYDHMTLAAKSLSRQFAERPRHNTEGFARSLRVFRHDMPDTQKIVLGEDDLSAALALGRAAIRRALDAAR